MANRSDRDVSTGTSTGATGVSDWATEERYWRDTWRTRPYVKADQGFDFYSPGYRYGYESASRYRGRNWNDIENDLRSGWDRFEYRGQSTWENIKDAVRDAWNRVTNR